ncbi:hypothetical protein ACU5AX_12765 [Sphingomonas sp. XXL09]|uniref:hypothetical protein n=1 Tax=Sphingomonas sp. XXL09 TaxID=3457787 RepID=UPI00406BA7B5
MHATFDITVDPGRALVRIVMAGFFEPQDVARFVAARDLAHRRITCAPNQHVTLVDIRHMAIQSQDIVARFQAVLGAPATRSRRIAFVVGASLARKQIVRAAEGRGARFFLDPAEAEAWLMQPEAADIAA